MTEPLESRIAPAMASLAMIDPHTFTYNDVDGDLITVKVSAGTLTAGLFMGDPAGIGDQLKKLDLSGGGFDGANITITAKPHDANGDHFIDGDGLVNIGSIDASNHNLGAVKIRGDLGQIIAGEGADPMRGLASLSVFSLGRFSTTTGAASRAVNVIGKLGLLTVKGDVVETLVMAGSIGAVTIGGSVFGTTADDSGSIITTGDLGMVKIGHDLDRGDSFANRGIIQSTNGKVGAVTIGGAALNGVTISSAGDLGPVKIAGRGGRLLVTSTTGKIAGVTVGEAAFQGGIIAEGDVGLVSIGSTSMFSITSNSGKVAGVTVGGNAFHNDITSHGDIGFVKIAGGDLLSTISSTEGSIGPVAVGGDAVALAVTSTNGRIASVTVGGTETGGCNVTCKGDLGPVKIGGDAIGTHIESTAGKVLGVNIGGSLEGDTVAKNGAISSFGDMGMIRIGGDLQGSTGSLSGRIFSGGKLAGVRIGGSVFGDPSASMTPNTGEIFSMLDMGPVTVGGTVNGRGTETGYIHTGGGKIASVALGGLGGGEGANSGKIFTTGAIGPVKISGSLAGGSGDSSGLIDGGSIASVTIGGSFFGGSRPGDLKGAIVSPGRIGPVKIGMDFVGGFLLSGDFSLNRAGYIQGGHIASVFVGHSIIAGTDQSDSGSLTNGASIRATNDIGSITVRRDILGTPHNDTDPSDGNFTPITITARGNPNLQSKTDVAIGKITVGGRIERANILAGYDIDGVTGTNADAQIGSVTVNGDWLASNLIAGVKDTGGNGFGTVDDSPIAGGKHVQGAVSKIASVIIKGSAIGTIDPSDVEIFGIEAQQLGSIKLGGASVVLKPGAGNDLFANRHPLGATFASGGGFDFNAFEI